MPRPFVAVVTDAGHNRLANVLVTFTVAEGGGNFNGQSNLTVNTDSDGRALAILILGIEVGREFWGLDFGVTADTLIPRPESETVVQLHKVTN